MTESAWIEIGYIVAGVAVYALLRWRLMRATHEFRVQTGCEADRWARDSRVEPAIRASLAGLADRVYRPLTPWLVLLGLAVATLPPRRTIKRFHLTVSDDPDVAATVVWLKLKLFFALITTSPLACVLAILVLALGLSVRSSLDAWKEHVSMAGDRLVPRRLGATA